MLSEVIEKLRIPLSLVTHCYASSFSYEKEKIKIILIIKVTGNAFKYHFVPYFYQR